MYALHRLIGNLPGRGHGEPLLSPGFPSYPHAPLTHLKQYRLPSVGMAVPGSIEMIEGGMQAWLNVYEVQSLGFGQYAVFTSITFQAKAGMRPFNYTDMVMLADDGGKVLLDVPIETALAFDTFISPAAFLRTPPTSASYPATRWEAASYSPNAMNGPLPEDMRRALLGHYWSSASNRAFRGAAQTFSVCLGDEERPYAIINAAKSFLLQQVLAPLPPAVSRIASMTACVPQNSISGMFGDSAIAFVCPNMVAKDAVVPCQADFDLRTGAFKPLSAVEDAFIASMLRGERCALLDDVFKRYCAITGCSDPRDCSLLADYDVVLMLYMLENNLVDTNRLLSAWQQLGDCLTRCHHLGPEPASLVLAGVEAKILSQATSSPARHAEVFNGYSPEKFRFLWERALLCDSSLFPAYRDAIAMCPDALSMAVALLSSDNALLAYDTQNAALLESIFAAHTVPLTRAQADAMTSSPFTAALQKCPATRTALANGIALCDERHPDNLLTTLPLSASLLDGSKALCDALELMLRRAPELPDEQHCRNLRDAYAAYASERSVQLLSQYAAACTGAYSANLTPLLDVLCAIHPDTGAPMSAMLQRAAQEHVVLDTRQSQLFFDRLLPLCNPPSQLGEVYLAYANATRDSYTDPSALLEHLTALNAPLRAINCDMTGPVTSILGAFAESGTLISAAQSSALTQALLPLCKDRPKTDDAFRLYMMRVTQKDPHYFLHNPASLQSLSGIMRVTGNDMTQPLCGMLESVAATGDLMDAAHLGALMRELLPLCSDRAAVDRAFFSYVESMAQSMHAQGVDSLPWFSQVIDGVTAADAATSASFVAKMTQMALYWRCAYGASHAAVPDGDAFAFLLRVRDAKSDLFSQLQPNILAMYEALFTQHGATSALLSQFKTLFPDGAYTTPQSAIWKAGRELVARELIESWKTKPFFAAIVAQRQAMDRCGLGEGDLISLVQNAAEQKLLGEFAAFTNAQDYMDELHANDQKRNTAFGSVWYSALQRSMIDRFEQLFKRCHNINDATNAKAAADRLGCWQALQSTPAGRCCQRTMDVYNRIQLFPSSRAPQDDFSAALRMLSGMGTYSKQVSLILSSSCKALAPRKFQRPLPVYIALLCAYQDDKQGFDWGKVLTMLDAGDDEALSAPFSPKGQATISAVSNVLDVLRRLNMGWASNMANHLRTAEPYSAFTDRLEQNGKLLARLFPADSPGRSAVSLWLSLND